MAKTGAQLGNTNATKGKIWTNAIRRAIERRTKMRKIDALDELAEHLLAKCDERDMAALKELGDRLEGKPVSLIAGADGGAIQIQRVELVVIDAVARVIEAEDVPEVLPFPLPQWIVEKGDGDNDEA